MKIDPAKRFEVALPDGSPMGEASLREHAIAWHPLKKKFYLVADVVPLNTPHHPNTYDTELCLWSSPDLTVWTFHGVVVPKGTPSKTYDGYGVASPAGMAYYRGKLWVPFSARKTPQFTQPSNLAYGGHLTPILQGNELIGLSWTVHQAGKRYGIEGHAAHWQDGGPPSAPREEGQP